MRRIPKTIAARLEQLEQLTPPDPPIAVHWNRVSVETAKEFIEKFGALPPGGLLEDTDLSAESWADLAANMTSPEDPFIPFEERTRSCLD